MTWFKVDDNLAFHPKVLRAGNAAMGLWVRAGSWSAQQLTDGVIPDSILPSLGTRRQAEALVAAGLWRRGESSWSFHGWNDDGRQPTRAKVEAERAAATERQRKHRGEKGMSRRDEGVTNSVSHGDVTGGVTPTPSSPVPTRPFDDSTYLPESSPLGDEPAGGLDLGDVMAQKVKRLGVRNFEKVFTQLRSTVGPLTPAGAVELVGEITARARNEVKNVDAYVATACRKSPEEVQADYDRLDLAALA